VQLLCNEQKNVSLTPAMDVSSPQWESLSTWYLYSFNGMEVNRK